MEALTDGLMEAEMMIKKTSMSPTIAVRTRGETIPIVFMIKTIEIKEEEGKDLEEEVSVENVFTMEKKGIEHLNVPSAKEGKIKE